MIDRAIRTKLRSLGCVVAEFNAPTKAFLSRNINGNYNTSPLYFCLLVLDLTGTVKKSLYYNNLDN